MKYKNPKLDEWISIYCRMTFVDRYGTHEREGIPDESSEEAKVCKEKFFEKLDKEYILKRR